MISDGTSCFGAQLVIVDHELRFTPAFLKAREHLRRGTIGTVLAVEANVMFPMQPKAFSWWNDARKGGGALGAVGSHVIDALRSVSPQLYLHRLHNRPLHTIASRPVMSRSFSKSQHA